jgi:photosystem II stability/assembly factor-like uncharacterized protein
MGRKIFITICCLLSFCSLNANSANSVSTPSPLAAQSLLLDITSTGQSYIAVGQRGHVLIADQCQSSWQQVIVPTQATLNAVYFIDESNGWIVGHDAIILKTDNGGKDWRLVHENTESGEALFDVVFLDKQHGIAVGAYGSYLYTADGGENWQTKTLYGEDDFHLYSISVMPSNELVVSGEAGSIYLSVDRGDRWEKLKVPYDGSFFGSLSLSDDSLLVYGMRGHVYATPDLGYSWTKMSINTQNALSAALQSTSGSVVMVGDAGTLFYSTDGETLVRKQSTQRNHRVGLTECKDGSFIAVGEAGIEKIEF